MEQEQADGRGLEDEDGPLLDRTDGQGQEDQGGAEPPKDDRVDHVLPSRGLYRRYLAFTNDIFPLEM